jgi:hypothetical protein
MTMTTPNVSGIRPDTPEKADALRREQKAAAVARANRGLDPTGMFVLPRPPRQVAPLVLDDADPTIAATPEDRRGGALPGPDAA